MKQKLVSFFRRNAQTIPLVVIALCFCSILFLLALQTQRLNRVAQENQEIAKQNRAYSRCQAKLFARYTRDNRPITNLNLDACTSDSQSTATKDTSTKGNTPSQSNQQESKQPKAAPATSPTKPKHTAKPTHKTAEKPTPKPPQQTLLQQYVDPVTNFVGGI